ncbi:MFS transporter [Streptomyces caatingaensis]|uniref:MFS transporter n=1 Tax=Streptomyces caatingaensis TaxID=1678637 RepID=UPI0006728008|nr:MFS transporter [Streptomyces caatingaensis]
MPPVLWILTAGAFTVGTDAYVIAGVLPDLARDLGVTVGAAGQLVTVFAAVYALAAPVVASSTAALSRRGALSAALAAFVAGNALTAAAPGYWLVMLGRVVAAVGAAGFTPAASAAAADLVAPRHRARALAAVVGGLTAATALGVPLGTLVAGALGWRATLGAVAVLGLVALAGTAARLPALPPGARLPLARRLAGLRNPAVLLVLAVSLFTVTSEQLVYTYVGTALAPATGDRAGVLAVLLFVFGLGAVVGNAVAGWGTDRFGSRVTLLVAVGGMTADLALLPWWCRSLPAAGAAMFWWGLTGWMYVVPQQHRLLVLARPGGPLAVALNSSVLYLGIALGGALGGAVLHFAAPSRLAVPAVLLGALALVTAATGYREAPRAT